MALDLFRVSLGLSIEEEDGTQAADILSASGSPGADGGEQDAASVGTIYLRTDASSSISAVYQKIASGNSADDWVQSASKDYVDAVVNGLSWREPALVKDAVAYDDIAAAVAAANSGDTVDGVTITVLDRLLFTGLANVVNIAAQDETDFDGSGANGTFAAGTGHVNGDVITTDDGSTITVDLAGSNTIQGQDETDFDGGSNNGTFAIGTGHEIGDVITLTDGSTITVDNVDVDTIQGQDETDFDGSGSNGTFAGGTGHATNDVITMSDGSTITVDNVAGGVVTEFTVTTNSSSPFASGGTITQTGTTGSGVDFAITTDTNNEENGVVTEFTVTTNSSSSFASGVTQSQTGTDGSGINFAFTTGTNNEENGVVTEFTITTSSISIFVAGATLTQSGTTGAGTGYSITTDTNNEVVGVIGEFTVTTASLTPFFTGATQSQTGTDGSGINFAFTTGTANETADDPDPNNIYIVSGTSGNWVFTEDTNLSTDGDAVLIQEGTSADQQWVYDGAVWVQFGGASSFAELQFIRDFIGKDSSGAETPSYASAVVVTQNNDLEGAIGELDAAIGNRSYTEENFITDGETITASLDALDQALAESGLIRSVTTGVTSATVVQTVLVDNIQTVKWFVTVFDEGDLDQKESVEVYATHDGSASGDATEADFNVSSKLKLNGKITGLIYNVVIAGTGAAQTMGLEITSVDTTTINTTAVTVEI